MRPVGGAMLAAVVLAGCGGGSTPALGCGDAGKCVAEPISHCIINNGQEGPDCTSDYECPSGTACVNLLSNAICFEYRDNYFHCRPRTDSGFGRFRLQEGFQVPGFDLDIDETASALTWTPPADATLVACALFLCEPVFEDVRTSLDGDATLRRIENFTSCVQYSGVVRAAEGSFPLTNTIEVPRDLDPVCEPQVRRPRLISDALAGCWAYDETSVVYATELERLPVGLLHLVGVTPDGQCSGEGGPCYIAQNETFGTCHSQVCSPRCVTRYDCQAADMEPQPPGPCRWDCLFLHENDEVGVCIRE